MNIKYILAGVLIFLIAFIAWNRNKSNPFESRFSILASDGEFDCNDYKSMKAFLDSNQTNRYISAYYPNGSLDSARLNQFVRERCAEANIIFKACEKEKATVEKVNIFLENSGSMDGYVRGITEYEAALADIIVETSHHFGKEKLSINFVNSDVHPTQLGDINDFFKSLEPSKGPYNIGDRSVSELNKLFKLVLDSTDENDISIFVSDCIYSLDKTRSTIEGLMFEQNLTKSVFLDKSKEFPFSAFVFQMFSSFDGNYYDHLNGKTTLNNARRPYYIWIVGKDDLIKRFLMNRNPKRYKGYANSLYFSNSNQKDVKYELLLTTEKLGKWRISLKDKSILEKVKLENDVLQFTLALDMSEYPSKDLLLDKNNYEVSPGFEIVGIKPIPQYNQPMVVDQNDWKGIEKKGYTHICLIRNVDKLLPNDLRLSLLNKTPLWISESNMDDDIDIKKSLDKTFGISYLISGITDAFDTMHKGDNTVFTINLKMDK